MTSMNSPLTPEEFERRRAALCPKCLEQSWNSSACTDRRCEYVEGEPPLSHVLRPWHILIDRYIVGLVLGEGGYAITYRALDTFTSKKVVIKELFPDQIVDRSRESEVIPFGSRQSEYFKKPKADFEREIDFVRTISHPNIAKYLHHFKDNYTIYLVTEYEAGSTLTEYVRIFGTANDGGYKRIPFEDAVQKLVPIMGALSHVHLSGNTVHRDVSPDNIFIRDIRGPILIDFGSARRPGEGSRVVKEGFTPPEIVEGRATEQSAASDIYSLAATLYWCCTGDFAWSVPEGETTPQFRSLQDNGVQCPEGANRAVTKALARDPKERFASVALFEKALQPMKSGGTPAGQKPPEQPPICSPETPQPTSKPPMLARSALRNIMITETLIIILATGLLIWSYQNGSNECGGGCSVVEQIGVGLAISGL
jgi:serine/threonine protein kinase